MTLTALACPVAGSDARGVENAVRGVDGHRRRDRRAGLGPAVDAEMISAGTAGAEPAFRRPLPGAA